MAIDRFVMTGDELTTAITNVQKLISEHQAEWKIKKIYNYDTQKLEQTPAMAIAFAGANYVPKSFGYGLGKELGTNFCGCNLCTVNLILYLYFEEFVLGRDTYSFIGNLGEIAKIFYKNANLFKLCTAEPMTVNEVSLVGRRLLGNIYWAGSISVSVPIRF